MSAIHQNQPLRVPPLDSQNANAGNNLGRMAQQVTQDTVTPAESCRGGQVYL